MKFAPLSRFSIPMFSLAALAVLSGCGSDYQKPAYVDPNAQGQVAGTGIESQDVNAASMQAAQSIVSLPAIAQAKEAPIIIITPVQNKSSSPVDTSLYTSILRDTLLANTGGKVRFIDRTTAGFNQREQQMLESGEVSGPNATNRAALTYNYILTAELQGISMNSSQGQSDYFRIAFKLINKNDELLWTNAYQIKKEGKESAVYR